MGEKSPAFQFYPKDFLTDVKQIGMALAEAGAYWRLCCHCWLEGSLPIDHRQLARLCGATSRQMKEMWPAISPCFLERDGVLVHRRLEKEREKQATFSRRQSDKGIASAAARAARSTKSQPDGNRKSTAVQPDVQPKSNSSISYLQSPISDLQTTSKPRAALSREPADDGNYKIIERLAFSLVAQGYWLEHGERVLIESEADLVNAVKAACAEHLIDYGWHPDVAHDTVHRACASEWFKHTRHRKPVSA